MKLLLYNLNSQFGYNSGGCAVKMLQEKILYNI